MSLELFEREPERDAAFKQVVDQFLACVLSGMEETSAAIHLGYAAPFHVQVSELIINSPYYQQRLNEEVAKLVQERNVAKAQQTLTGWQYHDLLGSRRSVKTKAYRLAAIRELRQVLDQAAAVSHSNGVIEVPVQLNDNDWERLAVASQAKLKEDTRTYGE